MQLMHCRLFRWPAGIHPIEGARIPAAVMMLRALLPLGAAKSRNGRLFRQVGVVLRERR